MIPKNTIREMLKHAYAIQRLESYETLIQLGEDTPDEDNLVEDLYHRIDILTKQVDDLANEATALALLVTENLEELR